MRLFKATDAGAGAGARHRARLARPAEFGVDGRSDGTPRPRPELVADVAAALDAFAPDAVHIDECGPLGWALRAVCVQRGWDFTTSAQPGDAGVLGLVALRAFHDGSSAILVDDAATAARLRACGLRRVVRSGSAADVVVPTGTREAACEGVA